MKTRRVKRADQPRTAIEQYVIDRAKELRIQHGFTQRDLSVELDVPASYIGEIESNKRPRAKYNLNHIAIMAAIFSCSPQDFLPENL